MMGSGKPFMFAEPHSSMKRKRSNSLTKSIALIDVPPDVFPRGYPDRHYLWRHAMPYARIRAYHIHRIPKRLKDS